MTKETEKKYLRNPHFCPVCKCPGVIAAEWDGETQRQRIYCGNGHEWDEVFKMVGVEIRIDNSK